MTEQSSSTPKKIDVADAALNSTGFQVEFISPQRVAGRLKVTASNCQPFKVLHGGVSALICESLSSMGAHLASGLRRIAGIQMSINHHRAARLGDSVFAEASSIANGKNVQVWDVHIWKINESTSNKEHLISTAKVTFLSNMPVPDNAKDAGDFLKKFAKL